jgi:hypothetical protein
MIDSLEGVIFHFHSSLDYDCKLDFQSLRITEKKNRTHLVRTGLQHTVEHVAKQRCCEFQHHFVITSVEIAKIYFKTDGTILPNICTVFRDELTTLLDNIGLPNICWPVWAACSPNWKCRKYSVSTWSRGQHLALWLGRDYTESWSHDISFDIRFGGSRRLWHEASILIMWCKAFQQLLLVNKKPNTGFTKMEVDDNE